MVRRLGPARIGLLVVAILAVVVAVAIPVLAASPSPSADGPGEHPGKGPKGSHEPEVAVTVRGTVAATTDANGEVTYTLTADGKTLRLDAGPPWFYTVSRKNPLAEFVGKTVTITGGQSGDEIDVATVDGTAIREQGRPPWAGGWKTVGQAHPGWSQDKADRFAAKAKAFGLDCWPPGLCRDHAPEAPSASP